jgi:hypothetical protein
MFVISVILFGAILIMLANVSVVREVFRVPREAWPSGTASRLRWIAAGLGSTLLYPVAILFSIGWAGHDGMLLMLAALPAPLTWWLYTRKRLQANMARLGLPWSAVAGSDRQVFFGPADTKPLKVFRLAVGVCAFIGFINVQSAVMKWTEGDPTSYVVGPDNTTIHPRPYIEAACPTSVREALHLIGSTEVNGHFYERWSVVPFPGHLDEVFLDTDSGKVICP